MRDSERRYVQITPDLEALHVHYGLSCESSDGCGFVCTRGSGHEGPHVAHGSTGHVFSAWYDYDPDLQVDAGL